MKFNVSIPDDLWSQALASSSVGESPSAVIQESLRRTTTVQRTPKLDDATAELFDEARRKVRDSAEDAYVRGYRTGLRLALEIGEWDQLRRISEQGITAAVASAYDALREQLLDGSYPRTQRSVFVLDLRSEAATYESGADDDGDWYVDHDPDAMWLRSITIQEDGTVVAGGDVHPLLVLGTDAAIRDVLNAATPQ